jgi:hypothetical protein
LIDNRDDLLRRFYHRRDRVAQELALTGDGYLRHHQVGGILRARVMLGLLLGLAHMRERQAMHELRRHWAEAARGGPKAA